MGEKTGRKAASSAGKMLGAKSSTAREKSAAASALAQVGNSNQTSASAAAKAAKVLSDPAATKTAKSAAASALTQRVKR